MTYTVYADRVEAVRSELEKLARKAASYSVPFSYTVSEEYPKTVLVRPEGWAVGQPPLKYTVSAVDIDVNCDGLIKKDGWTVCARVEHGDKGNIVTSFGDCKPDAAWFSAAPHCDHCRVNRFRNVTFFCRDSEGHTKQVGRNCLKDYTGINPSMAVLWADIPDLIDETLVRDCGYEEWEGHSTETMYDVSEILAHAWDIIQRNGYRKAGTPGCTRDETMDALKNHREVSPEAEEAANRILEWMKIELVEQTRKDDIWFAEMKAKAIQRALEDGWTLEEIEEEGSEFNPYEYWYPSEIPDRSPYRISDMEHNCIPLALSGWAKTKHIGILAYIPVDYERYMERKARKEQWERERQAAAAASEYVGKVKDRITVQVVTARLVTSWDNYYGTTYLYKFVDDSGNVFVWYASRRIQISDGMTIKATVKDHSEYNGVKQTVITRCAVA